MARLHSFGPSLALLLLVACASPKKEVPEAVEEPKAEMPKSKAEAALRFGKMKPVDIKADCAWKDENGYNGQMKLLAADNVVSSFNATVTHPQHGTCRFDFADFRQTQKTPNVELKASKSPCTVRMWTQGQQVSVAFSKCKSMCTGNAMDYLWPILANAKTGSCG